MNSVFAVLGIRLRPLSNFAHKIVIKFDLRGRSLTTFTRGGGYVGSPKMSTFCQHSLGRKCQQRGLGGQKNQHLVNVVCERPLMAVMDSF